MKYYAAFDIGGSAVKFGLFDGNDKLIVKDSMPTEAEKGPCVWMKNIVSKVNGFKKDYDLAGLCISTTGMVDSDSGKIAFANVQMPEYTGFDVRGYLEKECNVPCEVENDVNCVVLAESISGAGRGYGSVLGVAIGTGIGGGFTENGRLLKGSSFGACEVGYINVGESDFEHMGSTSALCRRVEKLKNQALNSWTGEKVFREAEKGDADCIKAIDVMASSIAAGLATLTYVLNPAVIVLGGGVMNEDSLLEKIRSEYGKTVKPALGDKTVITRALYKNDAGMLGALYNFKQKHC